MPVGPVSKSHAYRLPPQVLGPEGAPRRVGVEIEFAAPGAREVAETIAPLYAGRLEKDNPHRYLVHTTLGRFKVELDTQYAHPDPKASKPSSQSGLDVWIDHEIDEYIHSLVGDISKVVVPYEIITPPLAVDRLAELNPLMDGLRRLGAEGTDENLFYAFGVHINPEAPFLTAESILAHLRAFLVLSEWLHEVMDIDLTRKLLPYIKPFPKDYALKVLDGAYAPGLERLIDDYLEDNPTRNRELDLLPLFLHLDEPRVRAVVKDRLSSARPTFHYRLPDCRLNDPDWSLAREWNYWVEVERLAADALRLGALAADYVEHHSRLFSWNWVEKVKARLGSVDSNP